MGEGLPTRAPAADEWLRMTQGGSMGTSFLFAAAFFAAFGPRRRGCADAAGPGARRQWRQHRQRADLRDGLSPAALQPAARTSTRHGEAPGAGMEPIAQQRGRRAGQPFVYNGVMYVGQREAGGRDRRRDRPAGVGNAHRMGTGGRARRCAADFPIAASRSTTARCSSRRSTRTRGRSTRRPARRSGRPRSPNGKKAIRSPPRPRSRTAW